MIVDGEVAIVGGLLEVMIVVRETMVSDGRLEQSDLSRWRVIALIRHLTRSLVLSFLSLKLTPRLILRVTLPLFLFTSRAKEERGRVNEQGRKKRERARFKSRLFVSGGLEIQNQ